MSDPDFVVLVICTDDCGITDWPSGKLTDTSQHQGVKVNLKMGPLRKFPLDCFFRLDETDLVYDCCILAELFVLNYTY